VESSLVYATLRPVFPPRKFYTEQMLALVRMQFCNHVDTQVVKLSSGKRARRYIYGIKFGMLQVRENEISLRKWSCGSAHLHSCAPYSEH